MKSKLLKNFIVCNLLVIAVIAGCKKHNEEKAKYDIPVKKIKLTLMIANSGSVEIKTLKISYDSNSCSINNLKSGQTVYKDIDVNSPFINLGFTIEYVNGKTIAHKPQEWGIGREDGELQIAIENDGKMYFR